MIRKSSYRFSEKIMLHRKTPRWVHERFPKRMWHTIYTEGHSKAKPNTVQENQHWGANFTFEAASATSDSLRHNRLTATQQTHCDTTAKQKRPKFGKESDMTACIVGWAHTPFGKLAGESVESL